MIKIAYVPFKKLLDKKEEIHWALRKKKALLSTTGLLSLAWWPLAKITPVQEIVGSSADSVALGAALVLLTGRFILSMSQLLKEDDLVRSADSKEFRKEFVQLFEKAKCRMDGKQRDVFYGIIKKWKDNKDIDATNLLDTLDVMQSTLVVSKQEIDDYMSCFNRCSINSFDYSSPKSLEQYIAHPQQRSLLENLMARYRKSWVKRLATVGNIFSSSVVAVMSYVVKLIFAMFSLMCIISHPLSNMSLGIYGGTIMMAALWLGWSSIKKIHAQNFTRASRSLQFQQEFIQLWSENNKDCHELNIFVQEKILGPWTRGKTVGFEDIYSAVDSLHKHVGFLQKEKQKELEKQAKAHEKQQELQVLDTYMKTLVGIEYKGEVAHEPERKKYERWL